MPHSEVAAVPTPGRHIAPLDGVRGIAIVLVLLHHFSLYPRMQSDLLFDVGVARTMLAGWFGVDVFFVLSGLLITGILYDTRRDPRYFRAFYARRVLRILPLYYATLAAWFFLMPRAVNPPAGFEDLAADQWWYWTYLVNVDVALGGWPSTNHLAHFWSLAIEEQFYIVWPFVVLKASRRGLVRICIGCIAVATLLRVGFLMIGTDPVAIYVSTPCRMDQLAIGALIAVWLRGGIPAESARRAGHLLLLAGGAGLAALFVRAGMLVTTDPWVVTLGLALTGLVGAGLVLLAVSLPVGAVAARLLSSPALLALGRYSYALYVVHHPVVIFLANRGLRASVMPDLFGSALPALVVIGLFAGLVSYIIAASSWFLFEEPILGLKRYARYSVVARY